MFLILSGSVIEILLKVFHAASGRYLHGISAKVSNSYARKPIWPMSARPEAVSIALRPRRRLYLADNLRGLNTTIHKG
jgi:hypothetical protein